MKKDTVVKLKTFQGTLSPTNNIEVRENYWKLIGQKGIIVEKTAFNSKKFLVVFEKNLDDFNLENHNPIKNSLYIDKSDLELY